MTRVRLVVCAVLALLLSCRPAAAQMNPLVPDPITTPELMKYAELLGLSDQQKLGLLTAHDNYKNRYREFQARDVRKLQDQVLDIATRFQRNRLMIPERKEIEDVVEQYKRVLNSAHAVDRTLFAEIQGSLTEEQSQKLPRAINARELAVYRQLVINMAGEFNPGAGANLTEITRKLDLSPAEVEQTDLILTEYESSLLSRTREVYNVLTKAVNVVLDLIDDLGLRGMDPQKMMTLMQDQNTTQRLQNTFDDASKPFQAAAFEMSQLNLRTYRRLVSALRPELASELREKFYDKAYDDVYDGPGPWRDRYRKALALDGLTPKQIEDITAQRDDFFRQDDALVDSLVNLEEASREYRTFSQLSRQQKDSKQEKIEEMKDRRPTIAQNATAALDAVLGPDLVAKVDSKVKEKSKRTGRPGNRRASSDDSGAADAVADVESEQVVQATVERQVPDDPMLPQPIAIAQVQALGKRLKSGADQEATLSSMYDDYRVEYEKLRSAPLSPLEQAPSEGNQPKGVDEQKLRRQRYDDLLKLDDALFDNLELLATNDQQHLVLQRDRGVRHRQVASETAKRLSWIYGQEESFVDVVAVIDASVLSDATLASIAGALNEYERTATPVVEKRLSAAQEIRRRQMSQQTLREKKGGAGSKEAADFVATKWREAYDKARQVNKEIADLNRQSFEQILAQLPQDSQWNVKLNYNQLAYPEVYREAVGSEKVLQALLAMEELSPAQRDQVNEIAGEFRTEYFAVCDQIVELQRQRNFDPMAGQMPGRDFMEREMQAERLKFDRNEIAARARMRLRLALPADIARRIPELRK